MTRSLIPEKFQWGILASFGLAIPALISVARLRLMCPTLELRPFAFLPLSGVVNGRDPQLFARIMHDLTHPLLLLPYAVVLTLVAARSFGRPLSGDRSSQFLFCAVALVHFTYFASYFTALFLPIGDMVEVVSPG
jgi:hypothetical protein